MNRSSALRLLLVPSLAALVMPLRAQTTSTAVITSCVSKLSGVSRIVASPASCNAAVENVVQWNQQGIQGPKGDPGPQGPPGEGFRYIIPVPATTDPGANGDKLQAALANITDATVSSPYVLQLDAGEYVITSSLVVPAYVSLRGALVGSTTLIAHSHTAVISLTAYTTLADLTVDTELPIVVERALGPTFVRDVNAGSFRFTATQDQTLKIQSSVFGSVAGANPDDLQNTSLLVIDSQIGSFNLPTYNPGGLSGRVTGVNCISTFNGSYTLYTNTCR